MTWAAILPLAQQWIPIILSGIGTASMAASGLPKGEPGTTWGKLRNVIDAVAFNFGNAKNLTLLDQRVLTATEKLPPAAIETLPVTVAMAIDDRNAKK
jgi:hypothetical protein